MTDSLFSCSCPKCNNSLFEAALCNPLFLFNSNCPFCAAVVHWARFPLFMLLLGGATLAFGIHSLVNISELPSELSMVPAIGIGIGSAFMFFGLIFFRIVPKNQ